MCIKNRNVQVKKIAKAAVVKWDGLLKMFPAAENSSYMGLLNDKTMFFANKSLIYVVI